MLNKEKTITIALDEYYRLLGSQKQVDKLENRFENKACCNMSENCSMIQQAVKDTAKELIEEIDNVKEIFPNDIVGYEQAQGWCMCIDKLKEIAKRKGVEVE